MCSSSKATSTPGSGAPHEANSSGRVAHSLEQDVPLSQALDGYTAMRRQHLHFYGEASRWLTPLFQSDQWMLPFMRTLFMNAGTSAPFFGTLTRQTLVGVRSEWRSAAPMTMPGLPEIGPVKQPSEADPAGGRGAEAC